LYKKLWTLQAGGFLSDGEPEEASQISREDDESEAGTI
jgi:hypothetical protein